MDATILQIFALAESEKRHSFPADWLEEALKKIRGKPQPPELFVKTVNAIVKLFNDTMASIQGKTAGAEILQAWLATAQAALDAAKREGRVVLTALRFSRRMFSDAGAKLSEGKMPHMFPESKPGSGTPMKLTDLVRMHSSGTAGDIFPDAGFTACRYKQSAASSLPVTESVRFVAAFEKIAVTPGDPWHAAMAQLMNCTPFSKGALSAMAANDVRIPIGFIAARPHRRYRADKMVVCAGDGRFAVAATRAGVVTISDDVVSQTHVVNASAYTGAAVIKERNVAYAHGAFVREYVGGEDVVPIDPKHYSPDSDGSYGDGSVVFLAVPYDWRVKPEVLNLHGNMELLAQFHRVSKREVEDLQWPTAPFYNAIYKWRTSFMGNKNHLHEEDYVSYHSAVNVFCLPECHRRYNAQTHQPDVLVPGCDFWKLEQTYDSCGRDRVGGVFQTNPVRGRYTIGCA